MLPEIQSNMAILHHNVTTHNIKLNGNKAEGETYIIAFHKVKDEAQGMMFSLVGDILINMKKKRVWKFSKRVVDADWVYVNEPSEVNLEHPMIQGANIGTSDRQILCICI